MLTEKVTSFTRILYPTKSFLKTVQRLSHRYSAQINRNTVQTIIIKSVSKPDVEKPMPTDAGLFDIIQKVAREIWDIPNDRLNDFDYAIYQA